MAVSLPRDPREAMRMRKVRTNAAAAYRDGTAPADNDNDAPEAPRKLHIGKSLLMYAVSETSRANSARLDDLILKRPDAPKKEPTLTGGDIWRASLRVGKPAPTLDPGNLYEKSRPQRLADYRKLEAAVAELVPSLPDVVTMDDVVPKLDPAIVALMGKAIGIRLYRALTAAGVARRKVTTNSNSRTMYFVRCADAYDGMSVRACMEHRAAGRFTRSGDPIPVGEARGSGRPSTGGKVKTTAPPTGRVPKFWTDEERREQKAASARKRNSDPAVKEARRQRLAAERAMTAAEREAAKAWKISERAKRIAAGIAERKAKRVEREREYKERQAEAARARRARAEAALTPEGQEAAKAARHARYARWRAKQSPEKRAAENARHNAYNKVHREAANRRAAARKAAKAAKAANMAGSAPDALAGTAAPAGRH